MIKKESFPENFICGAATASYQIEGAYKADGRGLSTWDLFSRQPGKVLNGDTGDRACDHYHKMEEDVILIKNLGLKNYRFSLAWPRIIPEGKGALNPKGLDFYSRLIDQLLLADITPFITLFHWDLPQKLQDEYGGWKSREVSRLFADYTDVVSRAFGDRVKKWSTINEITCFTNLAHKLDLHAPGGIETDQVANQTVHNALLGHGMALRVLKKNIPDVEAGIVENLEAPWPLINDEAHIKAARKAWRDKNLQRLFPLFEGRYDEEGYKKEYGDLPDYTEEEMKIISTPMDFIAYNFYHYTAIRPSRREDQSGYEDVPFPKSYPRTDMEWPITPEALYWTLKFSKDYFGDLPIYITENGMAADDQIEKDGTIQDLDRIEFIRQHLRACHRAVNEGINLKGYYLWSLMDNFEWSLGYSKRFGMVHVDYKTLKRTPKESARYYSRVIEENRLL